jgi:hypothetical protein
VALRIKRSSMTSNYHLSRSKKSRGHQPPRSTTTASSSNDNDLVASLIPPPEIFSNKHHHVAKHPNEMTPEELQVQVWDAYRLARILIGSSIEEWDDATLFHAMHNAARLKALEAESEQSSSGFAIIQPKNSSPKPSSSLSIEAIQKKLHQAQVLLLGDEDTNLEEQIQRAQILIDQILENIADSQDIYAPELMLPSNESSKSLFLSSPSSSASRKTTAATSNSIDLQEVKTVLLKVKSMDRATASKRDQAKLATDITRLLKKLPAEEDLLDSSQRRIQKQLTKLEELALQVEILRHELDDASPEELQQGLDQDTVALKQKLLDSLEQEQANLTKLKNFDMGLTELAFAAIRMEDLHHDIAHHQIVVKPQFHKIQEEHLKRSDHVQALKLQVQEAISQQQKSIRATQQFLTKHGVVIEPDPISLKVMEDPASPSSKKHPELQDQVNVMVRMEQLELALKESQTALKETRAELDKLKFSNK